MSAAFKQDRSAVLLESCGRMAFASSLWNKRALLRAPHSRTALSYSTSCNAAKSSSPVRTLTTRMTL